MHYIYYILHIYILHIYISLPLGLFSGQLHQVPKLPIIINYYIYGLNDYYGTVNSGGE